MSVPKPFTTSQDGRPRLGRIIMVQGRPVHYHSVGSGPPVLLLHGNGSLGEEILSAFRDDRSIRWIAPDRPGYGFSAPFPSGAEDPVSLAAWVADFVTAAGCDRVHLVAHSIAAGAAVCFAARHPDRLLSLTLIAPFCRPTPHRWMIGLRLAVAPVVGPAIRALLPDLLVRYRDRILAGAIGGGPVPRWLARFPLRHAARPQSVLTTAAELRRFNDGMRAARPVVPRAVPVVALFGARDETASPAWHRPWIEARVPGSRCVVLPDAGHLLHHVARPRVWRAIRALTDRRPASIPHTEAEILAAE